MKITPVLSFCLTFFCGAGLLAQAPEAVVTPGDLKEHGLLIWLPDAKRQIDYLHEKGMHKAAEKEAVLVREKNEKVVQLYRKHFTFCKVGFFYSSQENDLKIGKPVLLNDALEPDSTLELPAKKIIGGYYIKQSAEHHPFPYRHFRVENSNIKMNLQDEKWQLFWRKKRAAERDVIRLDKKLRRMSARQEG
jgi:hypothetical protein